MKTIGICTKHQKENIISQIFPSNQFEIHCVHFDTDSFGTFTPEVKRKGSQTQTALIKAEKALEISHCDIGIGSEGSFQSIYFGLQTLGIECVAMKIRHNNQIIFGMASQPIKHALSLQLHHVPDGNIQSIIDGELKQGYKFCIHSSGLSLGHTIKNSLLGNSNRYTVKGLDNYDEIHMHIEKSLSSGYKNVILEHDFRAHNHPERQLLIKKACEDLYQKYITHCPKCKAIGRGVKEKEYGLPCLICGTESKDRKSLLYYCSECGCRYSEPRTDKQYADPAGCGLCNP